MNREEQRILHGMFYHREMVGEAMPYSAAEINWLAKNPIYKGSEWLGPDKKLQSIQEDGEDYLAVIGLTSARAQRPLRYLAAGGYVKFKKEGGFFRVEITGPGADLARELHTVWGRLNVLYKNHRDGLYWFILTVLVSMLTAILTTWLTAT